MSEKDVLMASILGEGEEFMLGMAAGADNEWGRPGFMIRRGERGGVGRGTMSVSKESNNVQTSAISSFPASRAICLQISSRLKW